jgi:GTPase KRas
MMQRLAVLGTGGVGKTAATIQYTSDHFVESYDPTIEDTYRKQVSIFDGEDAVCVEILDTAGQDEYTALRDTWCRTSDAFLLVYSITSRSSFETLTEFKQLIERVKEGQDNIPMVIIGNKCDMEQQREVTAMEGASLAASWGPNVRFFEVSAKIRVNIDEAFTECIRMVHTQASNNLKKLPGKKNKSGDKKNSKCSIL